MNNIKPWQDRLPLCPSHTDIVQALEAEVNEARAALAEHSLSAQDEVLTDEQISAIYEQSQSMTLSDQDFHGVMAFARAILAAAAPSPAVAPEPVADTGNAHADRIINRLMSSDPDFEDCTQAAALIRRLVAENKGPDGFETWRDAAVDERLKRVSAGQCCAHGIHFDNACGACIPPRGTTVHDATPSPSLAVRDVVVTPELLRHLQLSTELGGYACANLAGGYSLITEIIEAAFKFKPPEVSDETKVTVTLRADGSIRLVKTDSAINPNMSPFLQKLVDVLQEQPTKSDTSGLPG